jgi:phage host-nuclease inhibitor protein Gam
MQTDIERLRKVVKSRGLEIIELQNKLTKQGLFYEDELQEVMNTIKQQQKEIERLETIIQDAICEVEGIYKPDETRILAVLKQL